MNNQEISFQDYKELFKNFIKWEIKNGNSEKTLKSNNNDIKSFLFNYHHPFITFEQLENYHLFFKDVFKGDSFLKINSIISQPLYERANEPYSIHELKKQLGRIKTVKNKKQKITFLDFI